MAGDGVQSASDDAAASLLESEAGYAIPTSLDRRGGTHQITFRVRVRDSAADTIVSSGTVRRRLLDEAFPFESVVRLLAKPTDAPTEQVRSSLSSIPRLGTLRE